MISKEKLKNIADYAYGEGVMDALPNDFKKSKIFDTWIRPLLPGEAVENLESILEGRYLIDVSDTNAEIVGVSSRKTKKSMGKFKNLMNKLYDLNLEGY